MTSVKSENSLRNLESYKQHSVTLRVKLILFVALFVLFLFPLLIDEAFAGCCLSPESGLGVYCTPIESGCYGDGYIDSSCSFDDCTLGCCCYEYNTPYNYKTIPKGYCIYKNETEEGNIGKLRFTSKEEAFVDDIDSCAEFCSNQQITWSISEEDLLYFKAETVQGYPKIEVSWALKQGVGDGLAKNVYICEVDEDDNCINQIHFIKADSPNIFSLEWDACYKFYLNVTGLGSFEENYSVACTGNDECSFKKLNQLFCSDDTNTYGFCTYDNVLVDTGQECKENPEDYCKSKMGHLGMMNQSNCNEDYLCFLDKHPSGLYSCYHCPVEGGMECYDYKSKDACETDSCNVGNCSWKSLGSADGIDFGICVNTEESNCDNCGSVFSSSAEAPDFSQSGNEFLYSDCTEEILNLLSSDEEICELPELCYTGDDEETCLDYKDKSNCEKNTCNVGDGAKCVWDDGSCGKDLNNDGLRDCSGLSGDRLEECELDFYPPESDLIKSGSVDDLENYKLKIQIWDRRNEDDSRTLINLGEGDEFKVCSLYSSDSNFISCGSSISYYANAENLNSEEIYVKNLISEGKLSAGEVNKFNYFAIDKNFNIESKMNSITIDLSRLEGCTTDVSCGFEGVCSVVKRTCDAELGVFLNTCEAALDEFKKNNDSYEPEEESCDGLDNDCDGEIDEDLKLTYYYDGDKDGVGNKTNKTDLCVGKPLENYVVEVYDDSGKIVWDCDDSNALISPLIEEDCDDGIDNNCNGAIDAKDADCVEKGEQCNNCEDDDGDGLINEGCPDFDKDTYKEVNGAFKSICNCDFCTGNCICGPDNFDSDIDGDGIQNHIDQDNKTPIECYPEENKNEWSAIYITDEGIAKDKDLDGVCDYADKCEDTVSDCPVELNLSSPNAGCPKSCADRKCWTDSYCSKCDGNCEACGGGNWQLCTKEVCESCSEDCIFTFVKEVNGIKYGNCTTCVGDECEELKEKEIDECSDGIKNNQETDVDCGGPVCLPCDVGESCKYNSDCKDDLKCDGDECIEPPEEDKCNNKKWDPLETDVDCGGICLKECDIGQKCDKDKDCISGVCSDDKICVSVHHCENGERDEGETDVDCGGKCYPCENGKKCSQDSDCESSYCKDGVCRPYEEKDSDGDGIPDYWEMKHADNGTDYLKADSDDDADEDGLTNYEEYQFYINGTKISPNKADTDGDGFTDKEEIDKGTNPTDPDDKPSNTGPLVLILVVLLIFLGILLYLFFNGSKKSKAKKPKTTTTGKIKEHPKIQISSMDAKQRTKGKDNFELKDKELFREFESDMKKKVSQESSSEPKKITPPPKFAYAPEEKEKEKDKAKSYEKSEETKENSNESESVEEDLNKILQPPKKSTKAYEEIKKESSSDEIDNLIETLEEGVLKKEFEETKGKASSSASKGRKSKSKSSTSKKTSNKGKGTKKKESSKK